MNRSPDAVVVGGGIVGLCVAIAVADRGLSVALIDDHQPAAASRASAGMLGPSLPGLPSAVRDLACAARDMYPDFVLQLEARSGVNIALDRSGILEVAATSAELEELSTTRGTGAARLDRLELASLEPALGGLSGAVFHPLDGWVDNRALMDALWTVVDRHERIAVVCNRVADVGVTHAGATVTLGDGARLACARLVIAGGAWCSQLSGLRWRVPVRPVKGELLTLDRAPVRHVVAGAHGYLVPRGLTVLVGATNEEVGFEGSPTVEGHHILKRFAATLIPELAYAKVVEHWAGLRPFSPDGLPILGSDASASCLMYACGFSRNGILLAPWAGEALAGTIVEADRRGLPVEFSPSRFMESNNR